MVLRSSLAFGSVRGRVTSVPESRTWSRAPGVGSFSGDRVSSLACGGGVGSCGFSFTSAAAGVIKMSSTGVHEKSTKSVSVRISGRVQGVFYRNWTVETAKELGVNGWVRNNRDGTVEAVFSGKPTDVDALLEKCKVGPSAAKVSNVEATPYNDTVPDGFERRPTVW